MSGPPSPEDSPLVRSEGVGADAATVEVSPSREAEVAGNPVRRALPQRHRRTVGAGGFADHRGPVEADVGGPGGIGPHPHMGLHTGTWLVTGELVADHGQMP